MDPSTPPYMVKLPLKSLRQLPSKNSHHNTDSNQNTTNQPRKYLHHIDVSPNRHEVSKDQQVNEVIKQYLKHSQRFTDTAGILPEQCECCSTINQQNHVKRQKDRRLIQDEYSKVISLTDNSLLKLDHGPKRVHFIEDGHSVYRPPSPDFTGKQHESDVYLTHPSKQVLVNSWQYDYERNGYRHERLMAEYVVESSATLHKSLNKLKDFGN